MIETWNICYCPHNRRTLQRDILHALVVSVAYNQTWQTKNLFQIFAIANGFVTGSFPHEVKWIASNGDTEKRIIKEHELTDLLKAMMAPVRPYGSIFAYTGGAQ